jgi:hypothetical protein
MVQSRIARWFVVIAFTAALLVTLGLAVIQVYDTHYRLSKVIERRPEILLAFVYGWSLSFGLRRSLYSIRPTPWWVSVWWAYMSVLPIVVILHGAGFISLSNVRMLNIAVFAVLGAMVAMFWEVFNLLEARVAAHPAIQSGPAYTQDRTVDREPQLKRTLAEPASPAAAGRLQLTASRREGLTAFQVERISTPEQRVEFASFGFKRPGSNDPSDATHWIVDRDRGIFIASLGGGAFEQPNFFELVTRDGARASIEARMEAEGSVETGLEVWWYVGAVEVPKDHAAATADIRRWVVEALEKFGYHGDPSLSRQVHVELAAGARC